MAILSVNRRLSRHFVAAVTDFQDIRGGFEKNGNSRLEVKSSAYDFMADDPVRYKIELIQRP